MANQIIEEMSEDLYEAWRNDIIIGNKYEWVMERLYNKGYRKIPENVVIVSKAEYNDLKGLEKHFDDYLIKEIVETRKETAEKFAKMAKKWNDEAVLGGWVEVELAVINNAIDEIAKEIKEG